MNIDLPKMMLNDVNILDINIHRLKICEDDFLTNASKRGHTSDNIHSRLPLHFHYCFESTFSTPKPRLLF